MRPDTMRWLVFGLVVTISFLTVIAARARDVGQWEGADPLTKLWYKSLMQPDNPGVSCCGEADAYWADRIEVKNGKVLAVITDTKPDGPLGRMHVPQVLHRSRDAI